jgi:hypothetical protein
MNLEDLSWLSLDYNHLTASDSALIAWLDMLNPGWDTTQTLPGTLQFSSAMYSVVEGDGSMFITVTRVGGSDGAISVKYISSDGSATAGDDYTAVSGKLKWSDGDASDKTFTVDILDDTIYEDDETFNLSLKKATGGATIGDPGTAEVTIVSTDCLLPGTLPFCNFLQPRIVSMKMADQ